MNLVSTGSWLYSQQYLPPPAAVPQVHTQQPLTALHLLQHAVALELLTEYQSLLSSLTLRAGKGAGVWGVGRCQRFPTRNFPGRCCAYLYPRLVTQRQPCEHVRDARGTMELVVFTLEHSGFGSFPPTSLLPNAMATARATAMRNTSSFMTENGKT